MKNCFDCKHACTRFSGYASKGEIDSSFHVITANYDKLAGDHVGKCTKGHTEVLVNFWLMNGSSSREAANDLVLPCYETPKTVLILDEMIQKTQEMIDLFDKKDN